VTGRTERDPDVGVVLRWLRAIESHDLDTARSLITDDFVHTTGGDRRVMDWDTWVASHRPIWEALPDSRYNETDVAVADHVVTGWFHTRATHTGHLRLSALGIDDLPPTGNRVCNAARRAVHGRSEQREAGVVRRRRSGRRRPTGLPRPTRSRPRRPRRLIPGLSPSGVLTPMSNENLRATSAGSGS